MNDELQIHITSTNLKITNMKKLLYLFLAILSIPVFGQKHFTKSGEISFYSDAPMEKIEAHNKRVTAVLDAETGAIEFALLVKSFQFEKALMQEHFNENYMESDKYPKALFKGSITNLSEVKLEEPGTYQANITGDLTIHGVTKPLETEATFTVGEDGIDGVSKFTVSCADYEIKIPKVVIDNIAKEIEVSVNVNLQPLNQ